MQSSFVAGLALGITLGGAGTFAVLEKPWQSGDAVAVSTADAGPKVDPESDTKHKKRRKRGRRRKRAPGEQPLQEIDERVQLSAADRKAVWRGPKVVLPAKSMDFGSGSEGRPLSQEEINQGIGRGQAKLASCVGEARGQAELAAKITLKFLVNGDGGIKTIRIQAPSYLLKHGLYECATSAVRSMRFARTGAATVVTVPLDLSF